MQFRVNGNSEAMRIDSSGNVLMGKTSTGLANAGIEATASNILRTTKANSASAEFNRTGTDGDIAIFWKDTSPVGSIGTAGGAADFTITSNRTYLDLFTNGNTSGLTYRDDTTARQFRPWGAKDALIDLGGNGQRFKDLYLSGGVYVGGTTSANYLDDYEEGTWTPVITNDGTAPTGVTYSVQTGIYTKIGNKVYFEVAVRLSGYTAGTGQVKITGLPFSMTNIGSYRHPAFSINLFDKAAAIASHVFMGLGDATPAIFFRRLDTDADTSLAAADITSGTAFIGAGTYTTTA